MATNLTAHPLSKRSRRAWPVLAVCVCACAGAPGPDPAGTLDAGASDRGAPDAGAPDISAPDAATLDAAGLPCHLDGWGGGGAEPPCPAGFGCLVSTATCRLLDTGEVCPEGSPPAAVDVFPGWWEPALPAQTAGTVAALQVGGREAPLFGVVIALDDGRFAGLRVRAPALPLTSGQRVVLALDPWDHGCNQTGFVDLRDADGSLLLRAVRADRTSDAAPDDIVHLAPADTGCGVPATGCAHAVPAGVRYTTEDGETGVVPPHGAAQVVAAGVPLVVHAGDSVLAADPCGADCVPDDLLDAVVVKKGEPPDLPAWEPPPAVGELAAPLPAEEGWATAVSSGTSDPIRAAAVAPDGAVFLTGAARGELTVGTGPGAVHVEGPDSHDDCYVARLSPEGAPVWAARSGVGGDDACIAVAPGAAGGAVAVRAVGTYTLVVLHIDGAGTVAATHPCHNAEQPVDLASLPDGTALMAGSGFAPPSCADDATRHGLPETTTRDGWVVAVGADGALRWQVAVGGAGAEHVAAVTSVGDVTWVAGSFTSPALALGATTLHAIGGESLFVARLDAAGELVGGVALSPLAASVEALDLVPAPDGGVILLGLLQDGSLPVGGTVLHAWGGRRPFLVHFGPDGEATAATVLAGGHHTWGRLAVSPDGRAHLLSSNDGPSAPFGPWLLPGTDVDRTDAPPMLLRYAADLAPDLLAKATLSPRSPVAFGVAGGRMVLVGSLAWTPALPPWAQVGSTAGVAIAWPAPD